ncbi:dienelactone hydrolase family protein [Williamsia sp. MIQD14]|uniref:dienelactone hydrolase family protein n=1 Tax=Williamsia sp. MIQD14 TaxID=3425703 RepID=UPI003DA0855C
MTSVKKLFAQLSRRGPHRVLRGDMAIVGLPGVVYTPESGTDLPGVAFGHGWITHSRQYRDTLEHLASWGIVVAVPDTERGPLASDRALAVDLETSLQIISSVRLGSGAITVHPERLALAGHGLGASAAVLAAGDSQHARALAALFPAPTGPAVLPAAHRARVPALILAAPKDLDGMTSNALALRNALQGDQVALRTIPKSTNRGLAEGFSVRKRLGDGSDHSTTQKATRAMLAGFLLAHLGGTAARGRTAIGDPTYSDFADPAVAIGKLETVDADTVEIDSADPITRLLRS